MHKGIKYRIADLMQDIDFGRVRTPSEVKEILDQMFDKYISDFVLQNTRFDKDWKLTVQHRLNVLYDMIDEEEKYNVSKISRHIF